MLTKIWTRILASDRGASMVEYALLVVLIAVVALIAVQFAGDQLSEQYSEIGSGLEWANNQA